MLIHLRIFKDVARHLTLENKQTKFFKGKVKVPVQNHDILFTQKVCTYHEVATVILDLLEGLQRVIVY